MIAVTGHVDSPHTMLVNMELCLFAGSSQNLSKYAPFLSIQQSDVMRRWLFTVPVEGYWSAGNHCSTILGGSTAALPALNNLLHMQARRP